MEGKYSPVPCIRDSAHKTFGPTDLTNTYSVCTRRVFGDIGHRIQAFRPGVRRSKPLGYPRPNCLYEYLPTNVMYCLLLRVIGGTYICVGAQGYFYVEALGLKKS
ncbi:hypothetical protein TNCV_4782201 [Trichonephila clavipes]|nr:hypothetical protein TNCV_4782201 [Trichonephila clavipes]